MTRFGKHSRRFVLLILLSAPLAAESTCENSGDIVESDQIREQRSKFNRAIEEGDSSSMRSILHEDVILITGTDSDVFRGLEEQITLWQGDFELPERAVYVRTDLCVRVSPIAPIALEFGSWRGVLNHDNDNFAAGHYTAKWRKTQGVWRVESEVYSTENCGGDFCPD